ncbi:putative RNA methyltransferase [Pseudonocardia nematodicida]|uniref:RNA methyltransferase n=1 Tax=Pseudonocardia nematodicida TaxID=1206997 RepID=A0ABV1KJX9_9PSEU
MSTGTDAPAPGSAFGSVAADLRCPTCTTDPLRLDGRRLICPAGHTFDLARQGYANLVTGHDRRHHGDDTRMVAARERFLGAGHYDGLAAAVAARVAEQGPPGLVVDLAGGTGYYLAAALEASPGRHGLCVELSTPALRRAGRAHPRAAAIGADVWGDLPVRSGAAGVAMSVFGPRNPAEIERVLAPGGVAVVAVPRPEHLGELAGPLGLVEVDPRKDERLAVAFRRFACIDSQRVTWRAGLGHDDVLALIAMGPTARHRSDDELRERIATLPDPVGVTVAVEISVYRREP